MAGAIAKIFEGIGTSGRVFYLVDRVPAIPKPPTDDAPKSESNQEVIKPESMEGNVKFNNVVFNYPSRPDQPVLNNISLSIPANSATALVGSSGAGKSTIGKSSLCVSLSLK
jgi:ABC-type multidrug transport system fused ATPase/permease subunit